MYGVVVLFLKILVSHMHQGQFMMGTFLKLNRYVTDLPHALIKCYQLIHFWQLKIFVYLNLCICTCYIFRDYVSIKQTMQEGIERV